MIRLTDNASILIEVAAAAAIIAVAALALSAALITATQISLASRAVTHGRLLAKAHLEMAAAGVAPTQLDQGDLTSTLTALEQDGQVLWRVEVRGPNLHKPLTVVGGP
jgi:hypothetical protein